MRVVFSTTIITERCNKNLANRALHNRTPLPIARLVWRPNKSVYGIGKTGEARNIQAESDTQFCLRDSPSGPGKNQIWCRGSTPWPDVNPLLLSEVPETALGETGECKWNESLNAEPLGTPALIKTCMIMAAMHWEEAWEPKLQGSVCQKT